MGTEKYDTPLLIYHASCRVSFQRALRVAHTREAKKSKKYDSWHIWKSWRSVTFIKTTISRYLLDAMFADVLLKTFRFECHLNSSHKILRFLRKTWRLFLSWLLPCRVFYCLLTINDTSSPGCNPWGEALPEQFRCPSWCVRRRFARCCDRSLPPCRPLLLG